MVQDQLLTVIEVCRRLQLGPGFSQKVFVKTLCKDVSTSLTLNDPNPGFKVTVW